LGEFAEGLQQLFPLRLRERKGTAGSVLQGIPAPGERGDRRVAFLRGGSDQSGILDGGIVGRGGVEVIGI
jgi:hypothetical protein